MIILFHFKLKQYRYEALNPPTIPFNAHSPKKDDMTTLLPLICIAIVIIAPIIIFQATKPKFKR